MQQHRSIWWIEAVCTIYYQKFLFIEGHEQPKTCHNKNCIRKYYLKGIEKFIDAKTFDKLCKIPY